VDVHKGMLLYGPPGTGKTMLVKALCNEAEVLYYPIDLATLGDIYVNSTVKNIMKQYDALKYTLDKEQNMFQEIRYGILYMDEAESVLGERYKTKGANEDNKVVNVLCEIMDGPYADERIFFIATTNRIDMIDKAFLRPGRFDVQIEMKPPNIEELEQLYRVYANKILRKADNMKNFVRLDYKRLARESAGFVGADVAYVMKEAIRQHVYDLIKSGENIETNLYVKEKNIIEQIQKLKKQKKKEDNKKKIGFNRGDEYER